MVLKPLRERFLEISKTTNGIDLLSIVSDINTNSHIYFEQWPRLDLEEGTVRETLQLIRRYEGSFQLRGLGIWLIEMMILNLKSVSSQQLLSAQELVEDLLRIGMEHVVHARCIRVLWELVQLNQLSFSKIFQTVTDIADQLPNPVKYKNFMDLFRFAIRGMTEDRASVEAGLLMLAVIARRTDNNNLADYNLDVVGEVFVHLMKCNKESFLHHISSNSSSSCEKSMQMTDGIKIRGEKATAEPPFAETCNTLQLLLNCLASLSHLHSSHPQAWHRLGLVQEALEILYAIPFHDENGNESEAVQSKGTQAVCSGNRELLRGLLGFFLAVTDDVSCRNALRPHLFPLSLARYMHPEVPATIQVSVSLFAALYLTCRLPGGLSETEVLVRESFLGAAAATPRNVSGSNTLPSSPFATAAAAVAVAAIGSPPSPSSAPAALSPFDDKTLWELESDFLSDFIVPFLELVSTALTEFRQRWEEGLASMSVLQSISNSAREIGNHIHFSELPAALPALGAARTAVMDLFEDFESFSLEWIPAVDLAAALFSYQEPCWTASSPKDAHEEELLAHASQVRHVDVLSQALKERAAAKLKQSLDSGSNDPSNNNSRSLATSPAKLFLSQLSSRTHYSPSPAGKSFGGAQFRSGRQRSMSLGAISELQSHQQKPSPLPMERYSFTSKIGHDLGHQLSKKHLPLITDITKDWELQSMTQLYSKLIYCYLLGATAGWDTLEPVIKINDFGELIMELLTEERLGLSDVPNMVEKCLQVLTLVIAEEPTRSSFFTSPSIDYVRHKRPVLTLPFATALCEHLLGLISTPSETKREEEPNFLFVILSALIGLCYHDRSCRRKVVSSFSKIYETYSRFNWTGSLFPLLVLLHKVSDCVGKIDSDGEEALVAVIVRGLRMVFSGAVSLSLLALRAIEDIGSNNPGLAHRLLMRPEIEDILAMFLRHGGVSRPSLFGDSLLQLETPAHVHRDHTHTTLCGLRELSYSRHSRYYDLDNEIRQDQQNQYHRRCLAESSEETHRMKDLVLVLRASIVCVKDTNPNPWWAYTSWSYPWETYAVGLPGRPLLVPDILDTLVAISADCTDWYRLRVFSLVLEMATGLMYNCSDGNVVSKKPAAVPSAGSVGEKIDFQAALKNALVEKILPLLPLALAIIIHKDNNKRVSQKHLQAAANAFVAEKSDKSSRKQNRIESDRGTFSPGGTHHSHKPFGLFSSKNIFRSTAHLDRPVSTRPSQSDKSDSKSGMVSKMTEQFKSSLSLVTNTSNKMKPDAAGHPKRKSESLLKESVPLLPSLYSSWTAASSDTNKALEILTERTVDALFAFLCLEDMFPMSTYLLNISLFHKTPVCACLALSMSLYPENVLIQRRGINIFKCFAENKIELSSLGMHASTALMIAMKQFKEIPDLQNAFSKIIIILAADVFARDNLLRYSVQNGLAEIIRGSHAESVLLACKAVQALAGDSRDEAIALMAAQEMGSLTSAGSRMSDSRKSGGEYFSGNARDRASSVGVVSDGVALVNAVLLALENFSNNLCVQVEALRILIQLSETPEFYEAMSSPTAETTLNKSRKTLATAIKAQKTTPDCTNEEMENILNNSALTGLEKKCVVS